MRKEATTKKISEFWEWFDSYKSCVDGPKPWQEHHLDEILERISRIEPGLAVELGVREDGVKEMTISPDGVRERFAIVEQIVAQAPALEGWEVVAFRQPVRGDFSLRCGDLELTPSELYFLPLEEDGNLDVIVYGSGFDDQDEGELGYHGLFLIDSLIGEYNCVTQVRHYDFQELPDEPDREGLLPLSQLASFIEARK
ncbi:MAG: hypothetical protein AAB370_05460 [Verrucomicrobiota bacterium]